MKSIRQLTVRNSYIKFTSVNCIEVTHHNTYVMILILMEIEVETMIKNVSNVVICIFKQTFLSHLKRIYTYSINII